ncbi:hypothetical protein KUCAC02_007725 [Chaenocephalus aceratus]|uniref:Uncharacterized protein n=1 Tax=Chaenocephalus aceratus TaxID=36190 RepID=A0ACB9X7J9_CHAAC|nr:hypothetical protein KUCAC02_007725 [Chaenocephalus aceratus]
MNSSSHSELQLQAVHANKSIEASWQQQKPYRRRLFIEEVGEMLVTPHIKKRGRLRRSSAAATMVSDLQGAAAGLSLISERKSRRHPCSST